MEASNAISREAVKEQTLTAIADLSEVQFGSFGPSIVYLIKREIAALEDVKSNLRDQEELGYFGYSESSVD